MTTDGSTSPISAGYLSSPAATTAGPAQLRLPAETMRTLGYRAVDIVVEHLTRLGSEPVARRLSRADLGPVLDEELPLHAEDPMAVLERAHQLLRSGNAHCDDPRFLAFIPSPGNYLATIAAMLAAGFNVPTSGWFVGPTATAIELTTIRWLVELLDLPARTSGLFVPGGSTANLLGLAVARDTRLGHDTTNAVAYYSDQTHFTVDRALHTLGLRPEQSRRMPSDHYLRLQPARLAEQITEDRADGLRPFLVVANAGTTDTGAVDPLPELAALCRREDLWLHVDGAYGAVARITDPGKQILAGLELADSVAVDPHKWLFQPAEMGCILLREPDLLRHTFGVRRPSYISAAGHHDGIDLMQYGIQQTREFRALRLWMSLKTFGSDAFRQAVARGMELATSMERFITAHPNLELVTPSSLATLTFTCKPNPGREHPQAIEDLLDQISTRLLDDGNALITPTTVAGRHVLRMCTINPRSNLDDLKAITDHISHLALQTETTKR